MFQIASKAHNEQKAFAIDTLNLFWRCAHCNTYTYRVLEENIVRHCFQLRPAYNVNKHHSPKKTATARHRSISIPKIRFTTAKNLKRCGV